MSYLLVMEVDFEQHKSIIGREDEVYSFSWVSTIAVLYLDSFVHSSACYLCNFHARGA